MQLKPLHQKRAFRSVLLVLLLCVVGMTNVHAAWYDFSAVAPNGQTLYYKITSNTSTRTVMLTHPYEYPSGGSWSGFTKPTGNLIIPYYVEYNGNSYSVTAIDSYTFGTIYDYNYASLPCTGITSVTIPSSVLTIGEGAFKVCEGITMVTIPTSLTSIGNKVFYGCKNLTTVNFNATNCSSVGSNTWYGCTKFTTLNLGNTVTKIPTCGFQGATKIISVTLPNSLTTIGNYGFDGCTALTTVICGNASTLATVGDYAFQNCSYLANINLPNTLTSIGQYAFAGCSRLISTSASQLLPNALQSIGSYAFQNSTTLAYIRIPSTVTTIGKYAFKGCTALNTVEYEAANCTYSGTQAEPPFFGCSALATVMVNGNVSQIPAYCFKDCASLTSLALCSSLSEIGTYAFYGCQSVDSLILPANLQNIGSYAFGNAFDLQLAHVESHNTTPPTIGSEAVFPTGQTIYVHMFSVDAYQTAENWSNYNIEGMYMVDVEITVISNPSEGGTVIGGGTVLEGETCTLTATANSDYVFVNWTENGEIVSTEATYSFVAESDRILVANFEMTNHWTAESYQNSMFMIGVVKIDGVEQASPTFELGAFCNGECRGSEFPVEEDGRWLYFMTIDGNIGDNISFRIYDHVNHQEMNLYCLNVIPFEVYGLIGMDDPYEVLFAGMRNVSVDVNLEEAGTVTGTGEYLYGTSVTLTATANPGYAFNNWTLEGEVVSTEPTYTFTLTGSVVVTANFNVVHTQQLVQGYNWFSTFVEISLDDLKSALVAALPGTTITINSQSDGSTTYNGARWRGSLNSLDLSQMYMINVTADCVVTVEGLPIDPSVHVATIHPNFNWMAFPLRQGMTLTNAFAGFVVNGDMVISQSNGSSTYFNQWRGGLNTFEPGKGYMYKSNVQGDRTFTFPMSMK